ncbi:MAG: phosphoribosylamine--glycine ligase [Candidatus Acidiferrales bacterium]
MRSSSLIVLASNGTLTLKILVIGGGGREHALVWKLRQSPQVEHIWCAPGNGGIASDAECVTVDLKDVRGLADLAARIHADLTVVGPELPLVLGIADEFGSRGLPIVGPTRAGAELEGSKIFAKQFMARHGIPTASVYGIHHSAADAYAALSGVEWPLVLKADGLCGGKGVLVTSSQNEARAFIERAMERSEFGEAGKRILLEEGLKGEELSYIVITDGEHWWPLVPTRDHKRAFDGDQGPNTGGMGAYSCDGLLDAQVERQIQEKVVRPTLEGLASQGRPYRGFLYFGLMLTSQGPKVLEFNCRLGDPETEAIVLRMNFDLAEALLACVKGNLGSLVPHWRSGASACVVLACEGYPGDPKTGGMIEGLKEAAEKSDVVVFHAATREEGRHYYSSGGRVLCVAGYGSSVHSAVKTVYDAVSSIRLAGCHYRRDIGRTESRWGIAAADGGRG